MVKWSVPARNDLKQIHDYIAKDSKYYAQNVIQEIVAKTETLIELPEIGRIVPEISDQNIRELIVYSYRLIYEISSAGIEILAILHGRCIFRTKPATDSGRSRPPIPIDSGHRFRSKPATDSGAFRPPL